MSVGRTREGAPRGLGMDWSASQPEPAAAELTVAVVVPTYRRPDSLARCLAAIRAQERRPDRLILVVRDSDQSTWRLLGSGKTGGGLQTISVTERGVVAALNAALRVIHEDIIVITDDDAAPRPDWLARLERHYLEDACVGGVGGRDVLAGFEGAAMRTHVGRVQWWGRVVGNHHLGTGPARNVEVLKGVNMSFRRAAILGQQFDTRLRGEGAQVHLELAFCLPLVRRGWRLVYDPAIVVDHTWGPRFDQDQRVGFQPEAVRDAVYNETLALLEHLTGIRRLVFLAWAFAVGTWAAPGLAQWVRFVVVGRESRGRRLLAAWEGRVEALRTWWNSA